MVLFTCLMIALVGKIIAVAVKAAWGIGKFVLGVVFFPLTLVALAMGGFVILAIILAVIAGIGLLIAA